MIISLLSLTVIFMLTALLHMSQFCTILFRLHNLFTFLTLFYPEHLSLNFLHLLHWLTTCLQPSRGFALWDFLLKLITLHSNFLIHEFTNILTLSAFHWLSQEHPCLPPIHSISFFLWQTLSRRKFKTAKTTQNKVFQPFQLSLSLWSSVIWPFTYRLCSYTGKSKIIDNRHLTCN